MNFFNKLYCRFYQFCMRLAMPFMPYREPRQLDGVGNAVELLKEKQVRSVLLVTCKSIRDLSLTKEFESLVKKSGIKLTVFEDVVPNPTTKNIEDGLDLYNKNECHCIIAFGGGSAMDCAKMIGARAVKPKQSVQKMKGLLKVRKKLPLLIAIPTTAGTGSETTVTAVVTDERTHHKYTVNDFCLIPHYAILDYKVTLTLPKSVTATTGMDALTHAVEAFIGQSTTCKTRKYSKQAVKLIVENLQIAYDDGGNKTARQNMLLASYKAGLAFTKSYVGYVHAVAHSLGGKYGVAHGLANAVILPYFLREYGKIIEKKLSILAKYSGIADLKDDVKTASEKFINWIEKANEHFGIPKTFDVIKKDDISELATLANAEANPLYPVPKLMGKRELEKFYYIISCAKYISDGGLEH